MTENEAAGWLDDLDWNEAPYLTFRRQTQGDFEEAIRVAIKALRKIPQLEQELRMCEQRKENRKASDAYLIAELRARIAEMEKRWEKLREIIETRRKYLSHSEFVHLLCTEME